MVTRLGQAAVLVQLPGAHFAAPAAVQDDAHAGRALGHLLWTLTHGGAGGRGKDLYSQQQNLLLKTETPDTKPHRVTQDNSKSQHFAPFNKTLAPTPWAKRSKRQLMNRFSVRQITENELTKLRLPRKVRTTVSISILDKLSSAFFYGNPFRGFMNRRYSFSLSSEESLVIPSLSRLFAGILWCSKLL